MKFTSQQTRIRVMGEASATVNNTGNGGALNTTGILVFLIYFVLCDQQKKQKLGLHDTSHVIVMHISLVKQVLWSQSHAFRWSCI